jgi:sulfatase maturation enzyme AslB (radical SAM superfamily)
MHDVYRQDKGSAPTFDKVLRGPSFLKKHNVELRIVTYSSSSPMNQRWFTL